MLNILKINWKNFLFPILSDIEEINKEADTSTATNNLELANDEEKYLEVLKEIKRTQQKKESALAAMVG